MNQFLRFGLWNANGLVNHKQELQAFIIHNKIDVMLISETHFSDRSYFKIPNFTLYHTNHPGNVAHGGSAILIKNLIAHYELPKYQFNYLQATSIVIEDRTGPLTVSALYSPPRHNVICQDFTDFFNTLGPKFLAGGDCNAKNPV